MSRNIILPNTIENKEYNCRLNLQSLILLVATLNLSQLFQGQNILATIFGSYLTFLSRLWFLATRLHVETKIVLKFFFFSQLLVHLARLESASTTFKATSVEIEKEDDDVRTEIVQV